MGQLLSVREAQLRIINSIKPVNKEWIPLLTAYNRVLGTVIKAPIDYPTFANSSMDGFAVRSSDLEDAALSSPIALEVVGDIPAGSIPNHSISAGQCMRIMTGAMLPDGSDAVVPVEDTDIEDRNSGTPLPKNVVIHRSVSSGENVRPVGQDIKKDEIVLDAHSKLRAQEISFLAMFGVNIVPVFCVPKVAVLSSGDELIPVGEPLTNGKIHDSNAYMLNGLVNKYGCEVIDLGIVCDNYNDVKVNLDKAVELGVDLILSSAGVSVGAYDFVRAVVESDGELDFWRVNMRPGKPVAFGSYKDIPIIGLPGNPVSAFVGFEIFVKPVLERLSGMKASSRRTIRVKTTQPIESDGRESYLRAVINQREGFWEAELTGHQGSGNLRSLVAANALLIIPSEVKFLPSGTEVDAWLLE